jgi:hypothetical protein
MLMNTFADAFRRQAARTATGYKGNIDCWYCWLFNKTWRGAPLMGASLYCAPNSRTKPFITPAK